MNTLKYVILLSLIFSSGLLTILVFIAFSKRKTAGMPAVLLAGCLGAIAIYSFGYAMELSSQTLEGIMLWVRIEHLGIQAIAPIWFIFTLYHTGRENWLTKGRLIALLTIPTVVFLAAQTLGTWNLLHTNPRFSWVGPFPIFDYDVTILMMVGIAYMCVLLISTTILLTILLIWSAPASRSQTTIYLVSSFFPWFLGMMYNMGLSPYDLDLTPFACILTGILLSIGFFRYQLLMILPLARNVIFEEMRDGVLVLNHQNQIIDMNRRMLEIFPSIARTFVGRPAGVVFSDYQQVNDLIENNQSRPTNIMIPQDGKTEHYQVMRSELRNQSEKPVGSVITFYQYTETKELLDQLEDLATHDGLTGVFNRRHFLVLAEKEMQRQQRYGCCFSIIICDLDHFKQINDQYGHLVGDLILQRVAKACLSNLRKTDILGRFGGEEFIFLLPETNLAGAQWMAERIRFAIENLPLTDVQASTGVTASFGVTCTEGSKSTQLKDLIHQADEALYRAKSEGRNKVRAFGLLTSSELH